MKSTINEMRDKLFSQKINPITYTDSTGSKYVLKSDLLKFNLDSANYKTLERILDQSGIQIMNKIKKEDRSKRVKDFEYGSINEAMINPADEPRFITVQYNLEGEVEYVDYTKLDEFLEDEFIPENIHIKVRYKDRVGPEYESIQLNKIVKLQLSELEFKYVMEYLKNQNIIVCGTSEYPEEEFENFDYFYRIKNIQIPESLSSEETIELFKKIKQLEGNDEEIKKIKNQIIEGNMRLAKWVLNNLKNYFELDNDWISYAYEGLIIAVDKFDVDKGFLFSTFASRGIKYNILSNLSRTYGVSPDIFYDFWRAKKIVEENYGRKFVKTDEKMLEEIFELLYEMGIISKQGMDNNIAKLYVKGSMSLDNDEMNDRIYGDLFLEEEVDNNKLREDIFKTLDSLNDREKGALIYLYGLNGTGQRTLRETSKVYGVTRERIRQIVEKALRKLRHPSRSRLLYPYLKDYCNITHHYTGDIEKEPNNKDWDYYVWTDQDDMSGGIDALSELNRILSLDEEKKNKKTR